MLNSEVTKSRSGLVRNLVFFLLSWFCIFSAYGALELLQSSLNRNNGLGVYSMGILYFMKAFSSLFGPLIVTKLTPKWTLFLGYLCHTLFIMCNFYPKWFTMIPASSLLGLVTGPLWICCGIYTTVLAVDYADVTRQEKDKILSVFNGVQGFVISTAIIAGNGVSAGVLKYATFDDSASTMSDVVTTQHINGSQLLINYEQMSHALVFTTETVDSTNFSSNYSITTQFATRSEYFCGPEYCPDAHFQADGEDADSKRPDDRTVYLLLVALGIFNICGVLLLLFGLQNIPAEDFTNIEDRSTEKGVCKKTARYIKLFFNWKHILLIPTICYLYLPLTVNNSSFNVAYVTCTESIGLIGITAMTAGVSMAITNYISGMLGRCVHRHYLFLIGFIVLLCAYGILLLWDAVASTAMLFVVSVLYGCASGFNMPQFSGKLINFIVVNGIMVMKAMK